MPAVCMCCGGVCRESRCRSGLKAVGVGVCECVCGCWRRHLHDLRLDATQSCWNEKHFVAVNLFHRFFQISQEPPSGTVPDRRWPDLRSSDGKIILREISTHALSTTPHAAVQTYNNPFDTTEIEGLRNVTAVVCLSSTRCGVGVCIRCNSQHSPACRPGFLTSFRQLREKATATQLCSCGRGTHQQQRYRPRQQSKMGTRHRWRPLKKRSAACYRRQHRRPRGGNEAF